MIGKDGFPAVVARPAHFFSLPKGGTGGPPVRNIPPVGCAVRVGRSRPTSPTMDCGCAAADLPSLSRFRQARMTVLQQEINHS